MYRLWSEYVFGDAWRKQFREVSELRGQLELCFGELGGHSVYVQHRSERPERGPVCAVRAGEVQDGDRHVGVSELLGEYFLDGDRGDREFSVLELRRELAVGGGERGLYL